MIFGTPNIVTDGLVYYVDAANQISYVSGSTTWKDMARGVSSTVNGAPTYNRDNQGYLSFNGSSQYVTPNAGSLGTTYTVEMWCYPTSLTSRVWMGNSTSNYHFNFVNGVINSNIGSLQIITPTPLVTVNNWYHMVATRATTEYSAYVNGVFQGTVTTPWSATYTFGSLTGLASFYAAGRLAQARAYNRILSAQEVTQNYNATKTRFGLS
jgi:hypothetical protein